MNETQALLELIGKHWGFEVGNKIKTEIASVVGASNIDMAKLQSAIATIQGILDANPNTAQFDVGQNIVTQLADHLTRITKLEGGLATLNGNASTVGSVAYAVKQEADRALASEATLQSGIDANTASITTLNGDATVVGSVANSVKSAVDAEAVLRANADTALQAQIDALAGGSTGSVASIQAELDATQNGAGLQADGSYLANSQANYIPIATSLQDADNILDGAIKQVDVAVTNAQATADANTASIATLNGDVTVAGSVAKIAQDTATQASTGAVATAKAYADATFVTKADITAIDAVALSSMFRKAMDCAFSGATIADVLNGTGACASTTSTTTPPAGGTGAVI